MRWKVAAFLALMGAAACSWLAAIAQPPPAPDCDYYVLSTYCTNDCNDCDGPYYYCTYGGIWFDYVCPPTGQCPAGENCVVYDSFPWEKVKVVDHILYDCDSSDCDEACSVDQGLLVKYYDWLDECKCVEFVY